MPRTPPPAPAPAGRTRRAARPGERDAEGERDAVVLFHEFKAWFAEDDHYERLTSSLVDFGVPHGDTSMSRTVSLLHR
mgnify:CR=1 FL=1